MSKFLHLAGIKGHIKMLRNGKTKNIDRWWSQPHRLSEHCELMFPITQLYHFTLKFTFTFT